MARLITNGFELNSSTDGVEGDNYGSPAPVISTSFVHTGTYALRCNTSAATKQVTLWGSTSNLTQGTYVRGYFYFSSLPDAATGLIQANNVAGSAKIRLRFRTSDNALEIYNAEDSAVVGSASTTTLTTGKWYRLELKIDTTTISSTAVEARITPEGGSTETFGTGTCNLASGIGRWAFGTVGVATTCDVYVDDIAINDDSGTNQNSWPGEGHVAIMRPNATGDTETAGIGKTGDTPGWKCIDEVTPDDATTYISIAATSDTIDVNLDSSSTAGIPSTALINVVQMGYRFSATTASSCSITPRIRSASGGTAVDGTATTVNVTSWVTNFNGNKSVYPLTSYTDPTTGVAWTATGTNSLDNAQIGFTSTDATPDPQITAAWLLVDYTNAPTVSLSSPADGGSTSNTTPDLTFTGTDTDSDDITYQVQVDTVNTFDTQTGATPTYVQGTDGATNVSNPCVLTAFGSNTTAGNLIVVSIKSTAAITSVTDASGNTYYLATSKLATGLDNEIWYAYNIVGGVKPVITVTSSSGGDTLAVVAQEFSGIQSDSNPLDKTAVGSGTGGTVTTANTATLSQADELVVGGICDFAASPTAGSGYSNLRVKVDGGGGNYAAIESKVVSATTAVAATFSGPASNWSACVATFKAAPDYPLLDKISGTDAGFAGSPDNSDPFTSGQAVTYTVQSALSLTTYYWRVRGIDPDGSNQWGPWSSTRSFTVTSAGGTATLVFGRRMRGFGT